MKRIISLCLAMVFLLCAAPAYAAETGTCGDGISWSFDGGLLTVSGEGKMDDMSGAAPWEDFKSSITSISFTGGVTYVGAGAFKGCKNLTSVDFGSAMYELGAEAFRDCDGLTALSMPASFKVFGSGSLQSCDNLKRIDCAGRFPSFRENCLWDTYVTFYYPAERPWPVDTIKQLESSFHGRVEFLCADGTDPNPPQEETTPPTTQPSTEATEPSTTAPTETTADTTPTFSLPGLTTPIFTVPQHSAQPTQAPAVSQQDDHTVLWLCLLLLLSVSAAAAALIIHNQQVKRRRKQRRRRRPQ